MRTAREHDFHLTVDRAAGLLTDATCAARSATSLPLPPPHLRWMRRAVRNLEAAQDDLFKARSDPFSCPPPKSDQLELC